MMYGICVVVVIFRVCHYFLLFVAALSITTCCFSSCHIQWTVKLVQFLIIPYSAFSRTGQYILHKTFLPKLRSHSWSICINVRVFLLYFRTCLTRVLYMLTFYWVKYNSRHDNCNNLAKMRQACQGAVGLCQIIMTPQIVLTLHKDAQEIWPPSARNVYVWLPHQLTPFGATNKIRAISSVVSAVRCRRRMYTSCALMLQSGEWQSSEIIVLLFILLQLSFKLSVWHTELHCLNSLPYLFIVIYTVLFHDQKLNVLVVQL
jgi:hypothetical protein